MMYISDVVRPGDRVDLEGKVALKGGLPEDKAYYITKIYDITEDEKGYEQVEIFMPIEKGRMVVLSPGEKFEVFFYAGKGIYSCDVKVKDRRKEGAVAVATLTPTTALAKKQRREFYRYGCILEMNCRVLADYEEKSFLDEGKYDDTAACEEVATIVNISGGGICFVSSAEYEIGRLMHVRFLLEIKGKITRCDCITRILSSEKMPGEMKKMEHRAKFLAIDPATREDIIHFIFEEERKLRALGG